MESDMLLSAQRGMGPNVDLAATGADMPPSIQGGVSPTVAWAATGATFSTTAAMGLWPPQLFEAGGTITWKIEALHRPTGSERLLSAPAHRAARPGPKKTGTLRRTGGKNVSIIESPDTMRSVGSTKRGGREKVGPSSPGGG